MDMDGHFNAAHVGDRNKVKKLIEKIHDGDMLYNSDIEFKEDLSKYCCKQWNEIVDEFIQRGRMEYVDIPDTIPSLCKCSK